MLFSLNLFRCGLDDRFLLRLSKKTADWICWADLIFTLNAMDSSSFWWRGWELSINLGILLYVLHTCIYLIVYNIYIYTCMFRNRYIYIYTYLTFHSCRICRNSRLQPRFVPQKLRFLPPPNVTPLRKWASWSGLMNHPFPLIRLLCP